MASAELAAVGNRKRLGPITAGHVFWISMAIGRSVRSVTNVGRNDHESQTGRTAETVSEGELR